MSDVLHIQDEQKPKLTLCGAWSRSVTLLGDDFDTDERSVCLRCTRRLIALKAQARLTTPQGAPRETPPCCMLNRDGLTCDCARCWD